MPFINAQSLSIIMTGEIMGPGPQHNCGAATALTVGVATAAYVERLLTARDHVEQGVRSCLGILRLATRYEAAELEAACVRALTAGAISSTFVEQLLKIGRPITDSPADGSIGHHENIRGSDYYH